MNEEQKYSEFRKKLRSLPRIHASRDFEHKLFQRIKLEKESYATAKHRDSHVGRNWILNILKQPAFAPALAFASIVVIGLVIYLSFFTQNKVETTAVQTPDLQKNYSVDQLESLKSKVESLGMENRDIAKKDEMPAPSPKIRTDVSDHRSDVESRVSDIKTVEPTRSEETPLEKTAGPEKLEKKEAPPIDKDDLERIEKKGKLDETLGKSVMPSNEQEIAPSKGYEKVDQNQTITQDTTKSQDISKKRKSKKKEKKSESPPVEQKIQDTITK
jgi:hypothetical protein